MKGAVQELLQFIQNKEELFIELKKQDEEVFEKQKKEHVLEKIQQVLLGRYKVAEKVKEIEKKYQEQAELLKAHHLEELAEVSKESEALKMKVEEGKVTSGALWRQLQTLQEQEQKCQRQLLEQKQKHEEQVTSSEASTKKK